MWIDLHQFVKELLAVKANQEELTKRVEALEVELFSDVQIPFGKSGEMND